MNHFDVAVQIHAGAETNQKIYFHYCRYYWPLSCYWLTWLSLGKMALLAKNVVRLVWGQMKFDEKSSQLDTRVTL